MNYTFPEIRSFKEVSEAIEGNDSFIVKRDEVNGLIVVNYVNNIPSTFPEFIGDAVEDRKSAILRECRGIKFCIVTEKIISRPYHKFFNLNERADAQVTAEDLAREHVILEKLDGSMITPVLNHRGETLWTTKMGVTEVSDFTKGVLSKNPEYHKLATWAFSQGEMGYTLIFEFCSRKNKIVIDYPVDKLVLTGIRDNVTGAYMDYT